MILSLFSITVIYLLLSFNHDTVRELIITLVLDRPKKISTLLSCLITILVAAILSIAMLLTLIYWSIEFLMKAGFL